ncbi:16S rRNA (cytosine(967)-C(5))-methyltransferase RsmB [Streptococcus orisasini]|uniref:16S rRNA (cytosine(967)-C(5))-methyltransferase RsmB n=1 Tax=Streptococcus orisasini TaxID=1080071 RepID=UPI00070EA6D2|nr:16S rRNA (cytosine(967)-C(5))-methyltransferase RsmB [Streptococcus orisasini]
MVWVKNLKWVIILESKQQLARSGALTVLTDIFDKGAYSNIALNHYLKNHSLSQQDKALLTELVYGSLSRKITLEWYLAHYIEDRNRLETWVYYLLMLSLYQILYLDKIPEHAIVNDAVTIAKKRHQGAAKLVNAVLRQFLRQEIPDVKAIKRKNKRYSVEYSLPVWLVKKIIDEFGEDRAVAIFKSLLIRSKASIRVVNPAELEKVKRMTGSEKSVLSPVGLVKAAGHFSDSDLFKEGKITIQDESSQLVAPTLELQEDDSVLDACSAPGGKAVHLASYLKSGRLTALDLYDHKLKLIEDNARRLGVSDKIKTQKLDARKVHEQFAPDTFDKILVDAPCSGIGLIRRKPDIKYNKAGQDLLSLQKIQLEILDSVCQTIKKGGIITYSTCTIFKEENQMVLKQFLDGHPNFEQVKLHHKQEDIVVDGCLVITPEQYLTDGFFISQIKRIS